MSDKQTLPHVRSVVPVRTLRVEVVQGPDKGLSKTTTSDTIAIGSAPQNDLILTDDTVSRFHLELHHLGSRHGARPRPKMAPPAACGSRRDGRARHGFER